jgi:DNA (cytosine-5)-methyltransferase 1
VARRFGPLVFDLAATAENAKAPVFLTEAENALSQPWTGFIGNGWLNPPFNDIAPWAERCALYGCPERHILLLVPASVDSNWYANHVHRQAFVLALNPRLKFVGATDPYPKSLMLAVYGLGVHGFDVWRWK